MRHVAALFFLLACVPAAAAVDDDSFDCQPTAQVSCTADGTCSSEVVLVEEVRFWPEWTAVNECRASSCPPMGPSIAICRPGYCGSGAVDYAYEPTGDPSLRKGMAYTAPFLQPRLYTATHYALAFEPASGTLTLSRIYPEGQWTVWLACEPTAAE